MSMRERFRLLCRGHLRNTDTLTDLLLLIDNTSLTQYVILHYVA